MFAFFILLFSLPTYAEWKNTSEAGVVVASGNSSAQTVNLKHKTAHNWETSVISLRGDYLQSKSNGVLSANIWLTELRYERGLGGRWSMVLAQSVEGDRFAGIKQRYNTDIGPKALLYFEENAWDWSAEIGYRFTRENQYNGNKISRHQARVFTDLKRTWSPTASSRLWAEYIPNFTDSSDWLLNSELSTSANLNSVLALKLAYLVKYDNKPATGIPNKTDSVFTTALVATY